MEDPGGMTQGYSHGITRVPVYWRQLPTAIDVRQGCG